MTTNNDLALRIIDVSWKVNRTRGYCETFLSLVHDRGAWTLYADKDLAGERVLVRARSARTMLTFLDGMVAALDARDCPVEMERRSA